MTNQMAVDEASHADCIEGEVLEETLAGIIAFRHRHRDSLSKQHIDTCSQPVKDKETKKHSTLKFFIH